MVIGAEHHSVHTAHFHRCSQSDWVETHAVDQDVGLQVVGWRPLVSAPAGGAAEKTEEPRPKQQGARLSCDRSCQGQLELSPRYSSIR
jgi:hypothetical protein